MSAPRSSAPRRWRVWLTLALVFFFGAAVVAGTTAFLGLQAIRRSLRALPQESGGFAARTAVRIGQDLRRELQLSDDQAKDVQRRLNESAGRMRTIRREAIGRVETELRASTEEIAASLPPDKRMAFYDLIRWRFERLGLEPPTAPQN